MTGFDKKPWDYIKGYYEILEVTLSYVRVSYKGMKVNNKSQGESDQLISF
jgi:hypothetical protein